MNNNINLNDLSFGDITYKSRVFQQICETAIGAAANLWDLGFGYLQENENVFSGNVAQETIKWQGRIHNLGVIMRDGQESPSFNSKM